MASTAAVCLRGILGGLQAISKSADRLLVLVRALRTAASSSQ